MSSVVRGELSVNESLDSITSTTRREHSVMPYFHNKWAFVVGKPAGVQTKSSGLVWKAVSSREAPAAHTSKQQLPGWGHQQFLSPHRAGNL